MTPFEAKISALVTVAMIPFMVLERATPVLEEVMVSDSLFPIVTVTGVLVRVVDNTAPPSYK
jgi:hypothetical protein